MEIKVGRGRCCFNKTKLARLSLNDERVLKAVFLESEKLLKGLKRSEEVER
jgi:hypothetical protein